VRIIHFTDVHFHRGRALGNVVGKRALGLANLYLRGRRREYDPDLLVARFVEEMAALAPDLVIFSGDMTALATEGEFAAAQACIEPLLKSRPCILIPGNHDRYAADAAERMERFFGPWMQGGRWDDSSASWTGGSERWPHRFDVGGLVVLTTDSNRPGILSNGEHSPGQLDDLRIALKEAGAERSIVVGHYPLLEPSGAPYDRRGRCLLDRDALEQVLTDAGPMAYLHGHEHRWYTGELQSSSGRAFPLLGCGSTAYSGHNPDKHAGFYLLEAGADGLNSVQRYRWNGSSFVPFEQVLPKSS